VHREISRYLSCSGLIRVKKAIKEDDFHVSERKMDEEGFRIYAVWIMQIRSGRFAPTGCECSKSRELSLKPCEGYLLSDEHVLLDVDQFDAQGFAFEIP
jgi:hypothetical protein